MEQVHTLESVRGDLTKLEQVAREIYVTKENDAL
jgi:hypothetical protein